MMEQQSVQPSFIWEKLPEGYVANLGRINQIESRILGFLNLMVGFF